MGKRNSITLNILLYLYAIRKGDTEHDPFMSLSNICSILEKEFDTKITRSALHFRYQRMVTTGVVRKNYPPINLDETYADFCKNYLNKGNAISRGLSISMPTPTEVPEKPVVQKQEVDNGISTTGSTEAERIRKLLPKENQPTSVAKPFVRPDTSSQTVKTTEEGTQFDFSKFQPRE